MKRVALVLIAGAAVGGCALSNESSATDALIVNPTDASRAELASTVNAALGKQVTLADDALTRTSTMTIERTPIRDASGRRIEVREREGPELFRLIKRGTQCVLIQERTGREFVLRSATCVPSQ
jgi:hypothetical protein